MARAEKRVSTQSRIASKDKAEKVAEPAASETEEQIDARHAEAFCELETPLRELWCMAEIAFDAACQGTGKDEVEVLHFAVGRLREAVRDLRAEYMAERAGKAVAS
jgi:hypothetical protein